MKTPIIAIVLVVIILVVGVSLLFEKQHPYLLEPISIVQASSTETQVQRWVNLTNQILHVFSTQAVEVCVVPKYSSGYDSLFIRRKRNSTKHDCLMDYSFKFPANGAPEAVSLIGDAFPEVIEKKLNK